MNTYKSYLSIALIGLIVCALLTSCDLFNQRDRTYQGPAKVEFTPTARTLVLDSTQAVATRINAQLIGEQRSSDLTLDVSVIDSATTAQSGVHYSLPSNTITIPADSSSVPFDIIVSGENLSPNEVVTLALRLEGNGDVESANILGRFDLTLQGAQ